MDDINSVKKKLEKLIDFNFFEKAVLSSPLKKEEGLCFKAVISKTAVKGKEGFQVSRFIDKKVIHENVIGEKENLSRLLSEKIIEIMADNFKQCGLFSDRVITILMNKKRCFKIVGNKKNENIDTNTGTISHNDEKNYIIKEGEYAHWLYETGLIDKNGNVHNSMRKKFRQINRFAEMISDVEKYVPEGGTIIDMGCGKSYLTFAVYYYFNTIKNKNVTIKGFDLKKDVVDFCNSIAEKSGFSNLKFFAADIGDERVSKENADMLITLHACDTATDIAIAHGIKWGCKVIMSVPCCHHELYGQVKNDTLDRILSYGILKERFSALLTDGIRAETLRLCGYKTSVLEFIDMEHTPKNIMIRAVKKDNYHVTEKDVREYERLIKEFNISPSIIKLLKGSFSFPLS